MDWNRAKSILIAMFLIINIFLSYQLYTINRSQYKYINQEELQNVIQYLNNKNIKVEAEIPNRVLIIPSIRVKFYEFNSKIIEKLSSGSKGNNNKVSVDIKDGVFLTYKDESIAIDQIDVDEDKCLNNAKSFVNKLKLNTKNQYVKQKDVEKGYVRLILGQEYNNIPIEGSQIEIIATEKGVAQANINWFESVKPEKRSNITTPVMALLAAYENKKEKDETVTIKQIRQGYYFNPKLQNGPDATIAIEGSLSPMWIIVSEKTEIYVNAYNEKIEKAQ